MQKLILAGAGGCMRELIWQIQEYNSTCPTWEIQGFVDQVKPTENLAVGSQIYPYLGDDHWLLSRQEETNVLICVGSPSLRKKIVNKLRTNANLRFPTLILGDTKICSDAQIGMGSIISMDCKISTNVILGDFVFLNMGVRICHDGRIGDFTTLSPEVKLAGAVTVGEESDIGLGTKVIQGITIGSKVISGAGSVIVRDVPEGCTVVGVPAKAVKGG